MSNLPMIPGTPSSADVDAMKKAMQALNAGTNVPATYEHQAYYSGGSPGRQRVDESRAAPYVPGYAGTSAEDVQQMKNLLERLNQINGETESQMLIETSAPSKNNGGYFVSSEITESSGKKRETYIIASPEGRAVVEGLVLRDAAEAVTKYLNREQQLNGTKVQEVLDLEETYNRNRIEAGVLKSRYQRAVQLGESAAADIFKTRFSKVKAEALLAQDQIKAILGSIR